MNTQFNPQPFIDNTQLIETEAQLEDFFYKISDEDVVAVDIESAGFYKYYSRVNLIQIATRNYTAIIDPQKIKKFDAFQKFTFTSKCVWIFHGGDYDISMLAADLGIYIPNMFDTRKAAELLGLKGLSLRFLAEEFLGFVLDKKLQRCDWSRRPLTNEMKKYAILDAICLIPVYDTLVKQLRKAKRYDWVLEECEHIARQAKMNKPFKYDPYAFLIKGSSRLNLRAKAVLREVWKLRDKISERIDRAPFMLLSNQAMLEIARQKPRTLAGLAALKVINRDFLQRYGSELQQAVKRGMTCELVGLERPPKTRTLHNTPTPWEGELAKALREIRDELALKLGIAPPLLVPTPVLIDLARLRPATKGALRQSELLHNWQVEIVAAKFIPLLKQTPPPVKSKKKRRRRRRRNKQ